MLLLFRRLYQCFYAVSNLLLMNQYSQRTFFTEVVAKKLRTGPILAMEANTSTSYDHQMMIAGEELQSRLSATFWSNCLPLARIIPQLVLLYWKWTRSRFVRLINALPGPKAWPLLGNFLDLNVDHDGYLLLRF